MENEVKALSFAFSPFQRRFILTLSVAMVLSWQINLTD